MQKLGICANKSHRKAILEFLQETGAMEVTAIHAGEENNFLPTDTTGQRIEFEKAADSFEKSLELLNTYAPDKGGAMGMFSEPRLVTHDEIDDVAKRRAELLADAKKILDAEKEINECKSAIQKNENLVTTLLPWEKLDIAMDSTGTRETDILIGSLPEAMGEAAILAKATEGIDAPAPVTVNIISTEKQTTNLCVIARSTVAEQVEENLRAIGFARPAAPVHGVPGEVAACAKADTEERQKRIGSIGKTIAAYSDRRQDFRIAADYFRTRAEKYRVLGTVPQSENTFFIEGWVPANKVADMSRVLSEKFGAFVEKEEPEEGEMEPTLLKNNAFSRNVEGVLESYGLPQKGKVDPTFIMSIFYVIFFGMMLSDAGYGILMVIFTAVMLKKHPRMGEGMQKMLKLFFWCGLSTTFWGLMYGGFFGDAIDVIARTFFGYTGEKTLGLLPRWPLWFEPMSNPMRLLMFCLLFGVIHLFVGLAIKGYELLKEKDYVSFVSDILAWALFVLGLILMLLPTQLFESIAQMEFNFPPFVNILSKAMALAGGIIILLMAGRRKKNRWGLRILLGAYDIYGVTGWLSDIMSYSRLLALGLATGVIASVMNMLGAMVGGGMFKQGGAKAVIGVILFIIIFLVGHVLNFGINLLGAYVHTNRLQFAEFFGKFYEAGGEAFRPFKASNKYTEIKEEKSL